MKSFWLDGTPCLSEDAHSRTHHLGYVIVKEYRDREDLLSMKISDRNVLPTVRHLGPKGDRFRNPQAHTLLYEQGKDTSYLMISSAQGLYFPPQDWACGFLPMIPNKRVEAFVKTNDKILLRFDTLKAMRSPDFLKVAVILLLRGWKNSDTSPTEWNFEALLMVVANGVTGSRPLPPHEKLNSDLLTKVVNSLIEDKVLDVSSSGLCCLNSSISDMTPEETQVFSSYMWNLIEPSAIIRD